MISDAGRVAIRAPEASSIRASVGMPDATANACGGTLNVSTPPVMLNSTGFVNVGKQSERSVQAQQQR